MTTTEKRIAALNEEIADTKARYADRPGMRDLMVKNLEKDREVVRSRG